MSPRPRHQTPPGFSSNLVFVGTYHPLGLVDLWVSADRTTFVRVRRPLRDGDPVLVDMMSSTTFRGDYTTGYRIYRRWHRRGGHTV